MCIRDSTQPDWLTGLADIYGDFFVRQYDSAQQYYRMALQYDPWYRPAFENAVQMYRRLDQTSQALKWFDQYAYFENHYPELSLLKAICLIEKDSISQGTVLFENRFGLVVGNLVMFEMITDLLDKKNHQQERARLFQLLSEIGVNNVDAMILVAKYEINRDNIEAAGKAIEKGETINPDNVSLSVQKARILYKTDKRDEAFEIFEKNLIEARDEHDNNYYYSRILASEQIELNKATNLARKAVFVSNHDLKTWMNLCYVYFQSDRYDLCRGEALKASRKYSDDPEPFYWLGMSMYREGKEEAGENLKKSIALGLKGENLETARQILNKL